MCPKHEDRAVAMKWDLFCEIYSVFPLGKTIDERVIMYKKADFSWVWGIL